MANKVILEEEIEFPTIEFFNMDTQEGRTQDFIRVFFGFEGEEECNHIDIVSSNFKNWFREQSDFQYWDFSLLFSASNREYLRAYVFNYLQKVIFQGDVIEELEINLRVKRQQYKEAKELNGALVFQVEQQQKQIEALNAEIEFLRNQHIKKAS